MEDPKTIARKVLKCDPSLEWVTVMNDKGEWQAQVRSGNYLPGPNISNDVIERLGALDSVTLGAFSQAEKWYGKMDYVLVAHDLAQIILIHDETRKLIFAAKTQRSQNAEYLFGKLRSALGK